MPSIVVFCPECKQQCGKSILRGLWRLLRPARDGECPVCHEKLNKRRRW